MSLVSERIPDGHKVEDKALHRSFASYRTYSSSGFGFKARPIDFHCASFDVNQPSQLGSIRKPFFHLVAQHTNAVGRGAEFNHEVGADRPIAAKCGRIKILDAVLQNPGCIGRTTRRIGEQPARRGIEGDAPFVLASPVSELGADFVVASTSPCKGLRHDDQFPVSGQFEIEVRMLGAQARKGLVSHRTHSKNGRQIRFINQERHIRKYKTRDEALVFECKTWGQNDDITVVTVRRRS
jgi:hypothetical protein